MWRCSEELHVVYRQLGISVHMQPQWLEKQLRTVSLCQYLSVKECCLCVGGGGGRWCWGAPTTYMKSVGQFQEVVCSFHGLSVV